MKRGFLAVLVLLTVVFLFINANISRVEAVSNPADKVFETANKVQDTVFNEEARSSYLKQEWAKMLNKTWLKTPVQVIGKSMSFLDPVFRVVFGIPFSWSFLFFVTFLIFFFFMLYSYRIFEILSFLLFAYLFKSETSQKFSNLTKWLSFTLFVLLVIYIKIPKFLANLISVFIFSKGWFIQVVSIVVVIVVIIFLFKFSGAIKRFFNGFARDNILRKFKKETKEKEEEIETKSDENIKKIEKRIETLQRQKSSAEEKGDEDKVKAAAEKIDMFMEQLQEAKRLADEAEIKSTSIETPKMPVTLLKKKDYKEMGLTDKDLKKRMKDESEDL